MFKISPVFRLSIGLILLTVSLLLISDLLGLTPDQAKAELKARKAIAESLAVQLSTALSRGDAESVAETVGALQERNDEVVTIGLRRLDGRLVAVAGEHVALWDPEIGEASTASQVQVPIHGPDGRWGMVEIGFRQFENLWARLVRGGSIATVILFVAFAGFSAYWLFLKRALKELDPSAVVPDRVRAALDALAEGLVIVDRAGRIVLVNAAFETAFGTAKDHLIGNKLTVLDWVTPKTGEPLAPDELPWHILLEQARVPPTEQLVLLTPSKERLTFAVNCSPVKASDGSIRGAVVTFDDLTHIEQKNRELERALERLERSQREITRQNRELEVLATRDPLTSVLNRRSLFEGMNTLIDEAVAAGEPLSAIMVDIDHFKSINDRFGHATGDKVIKMLAGILTDLVRSDDLVGRYGGEEFCVVLPGVDEQRAAVIAEQMRLTINDGKSARFTSALRISASFGVATMESDRLAANALVDRADKALYESKSTGRNRVSRWSRLVETDRAEVVGLNAKVATEKKGSAEPGVESDEELMRANESLRSRVAELESTLADQLNHVKPDLDDNTGLPGRVVLMDRIEQAIVRSKRSRSSAVLMSVGLDSVELLRNTRGNGSADKLMRQIGKLLRHAVRSADTVAVTGGEEMEVSVSTLGNSEFAVLLSDMSDASSTTWVVQRIFDALGETIEVDGFDVMMDARIGVSMYPNDAGDAEDILANAAAALREARIAEGRDICVYYNKSIQARSQEQLAMRAQLVRAIEHDELFLEYQPSVDVYEGRIKGMEALMRWNHPELGLVRPDRFVPVAENAGLIDRLGEWVVNTALRQLKAWHDMGCEGITMAINFSAMQFRQEGLVDGIVQKLTELDLDPASVVIEITESLLIQNLDTAVDVVEELSDAGLGIALDDFGTGYSSLSYLKRFPIDVVKIDRSFLRDFPAEAHDTEIVSAIIGITHNLGLRVVAEGVETERQLQVLQNLQCDEVQGYLFSEPVSRERAAALLLNPSRIRRTVRNARGGGDHGMDETHPIVAGVINGVSGRRLTG